MDFLLPKILKSIFQKFANFILQIPRNIKILMVMIIDIIICGISNWLAFSLRFDIFFPLNIELQKIFLLSTIIIVPIFFKFSIYQNIFRYTSLRAISAIIKSFFLYFLIFVTIVFVIEFEKIPKSIIVIQALLMFLGIIGSRFFIVYLFGDIKRRVSKKTIPYRIAIYGAGNTGRRFAEILNNEEKMKVLYFIDDDVNINGNFINNIPIIGNTKLSNIISTKKLTHIFLAMPSISRTQRNKIIKKISSNNVIIRTLPSISEIINGHVTVNEILELNVNDLLSRDVVEPNIELLKKNIENKVVLVSGAGGSIGAELCKQIIKEKPKKLLLLEINEFSLYTIHSELMVIKEKFAEEIKCEIVPLLASVQNTERVNKIITVWKPNTIYHAAAYKHVPLVEQNLVESIKNNVFGTLNIAQKAIENGTPNFVLISTDKAVNPTNIMGASKRLAEMCLQALCDHQNRKNDSSHITKCSIVRFGNVIASSGSVIPHFYQQILKGGPITLTHPEVRRYFMTIPEAAQLVIQAGAMADKCEVFILDMGKLIKVIDIAKRMVKLCGLEVRDQHNPYGDIEIKIIGLRPGEKLYEELFLGQNPKPTTHSKIQKATDPFLPWDVLSEQLNTMKIFIREDNINEIINMLDKLVTGYKKSSNLVDLVFLEKQKVTSGI